MHHDPVRIPRQTNDASKASYDNRLRNEGSIDRIGDFQIKQL
jgi:hypothetical protein